MASLGGPHTRRYRNPSHQPQALSGSERQRVATLGAIAADKRVRLIGSDVRRTAEAVRVAAGSCSASP